MRLPIEKFWTGRGRKRSYFNSREGDYEDEVVEENGTRIYLLLGNTIATFDGKILTLSTAGWNTLTTRMRLSYIIYWGEQFGYKIPLEPNLRVTPYGAKIYWKIYRDDEPEYAIPQEYPIVVDVFTGEIHTPMLRVIPTWVVPTSRSRKVDTVSKLRAKGGYYIIRNGAQYLLWRDVLYRLDDIDGLWIEEKSYGKIAEITEFI